MLGRSKALVQGCAKALARPLAGDFCSRLAGASTASRATGALPIGLAAAFATTITSAVSAPAVSAPSLVAAAGPLIGPVESLCPAPKPRLAATTASTTAAVPGVAATAAVAATSFSSSATSSMSSSSSSSPSPARPAPRGRLFGLPASTLRAGLSQLPRASIFARHLAYAYGYGPAAAGFTSSASAGTGSLDPYASRLLAAERRAQLAPNSVSAQEAYAEELAAYSATAFVAGYEAGRFPRTPATASLYATAKTAAHGLGSLRGAGAATGTGGAAGLVGGLPSNALATTTGAAAGLGAAGAESRSNGSRFRSGLIFLASLLSLTFLIVIAVGINKGPAGLAGLSSTAKEIAPEVCKVRFTDVKGCDEARDEAAQLVHFLKNPQAYTDMGAELPRGMLLTGPPGTGKTLLAKAVAGEAGVPFFSVSGSSFDEIFVGTGAKRVRELFASAKEKAPCIVFIDEIDALGGARSKRQESQHRQTLNALLVEMDGFATNHGVLVMGATNLPDALDKALLRPGRFDRTLHLALPDIAGRRQILDLYVGQIAAGPDVDTHVLARATPGASGATLQGIVNAAAIYAAQKGRSEVTMGDFEYAKDKLLMGAARESAIIAPGEKRKTAYHEGGHAICALYTEGAVPIYKATVMPRGRALGMVMQLPEDDMVSMTKKEMLARLDVAMGGRVAEEVIYGADNVTSGASSDFQQATSMAQAMVMNYGFGKTTGLLAVNDLNEVSGDTRRLIDAEVQGLLDASYARSKRLITKNREKLERLADGLCKYETITLDEIYQVVDGKELAREI